MDQETRELLALVRQYLELNNEFVAALGHHSEFEHKLPKDWQHKLGVMKGIAALMPTPLVRADVTPIHIFECGHCGKGFDFYRMRGMMERCPYCGSIDIHRVPA